MNGEREGKADRNASYPNQSKVFNPDKTANKSEKRIEMAKCRLTHTES